MYIEPTSKRITVTRQEEFILREILGEYIDLKTSQTEPDDKGLVNVSFAEVLLADLSGDGNG